jgi:hypothetical protein
MTEYKTYLPTCKCRDHGVLIKSGRIYCRWCRKPYAQGFEISYLDEHFPKTEGSKKRILKK